MVRKTNHALSADIGKYPFIVSFFLLSCFQSIYGLYYMSNGRGSMHCFSEDGDVHQHFGTITPYDAVRGEIDNHHHPTCTPIQIWMLTRHGTRYAAQMDLMIMKNAIDLRDKIIKNYESATRPIDNGLCRKDYLALKNWEWDESIETQAQNLNEQGWQDMVDLATRYKYRYPELLDISYSPEKFYFGFTRTQRTEESCKAFIHGLFNNGTHVDVRFGKKLEKNILRPYNTCSKWRQDVFKNFVGITERLKFTKTEKCKMLIKDISDRLGFEKLLKSADIEVMYNNCRFDKTRYPNEISPWCLVFTKNELELLAYYYDLDWFYKVGYGLEYNKKLGCKPIQNMMNTFKKTIKSGTPLPKATIMFSHDTLLGMMFTVLNYAKDDYPLVGENYENLLRDRQYKMGDKIPFGANIVAVLHKCSNHDEEYMVQFFINEKPMEIKGCLNGFCGWKYLENFLSHTKSCNTDFCNIK